MKRGWVAGIMVFILCSFLGMSLAQQGDKAKVSRETKYVSGEVSFLDLKSDPKRIGIDYKQDDESGVAYEIILFIDENVKLVHKGKLEEMGLGDSVHITYEDITSSGEEGKEETKRVAKIISFARAADTEKRHKYGVFSAEEKEEMKKAKERAEADTLPLKGTKE